MDHQVAFRPVLLPDVTEGVCADFIQVKVERIFDKLVYRYTLSAMGPTIDLEQIHIVLFDKAYKRRLLIIDDERVMARFGPAFAEDRSFRMSNFLVCKSGEGKRAKFYLKLQMNSIIERDVVYLPVNCFFVVTLPQIFAGHADDLGVFDVCGFVLALYEPGMFHTPNVFCREVVVVLEDRASNGQHIRMTCILHGPCVDVALQCYKAVANGTPPFVVFQYVRALPREKGIPTLASYMDAIRVQFNPSSYELMHQRLTNIGQPVRPDAVDFVPMM